MTDPQSDKANLANDRGTATRPSPWPFAHDRHCSGSAALEFGLAIPLLLLILMGVVELGNAMYRAMQVYDSVEAGMLYAAQNGFDAAGISAAVVNATGTQDITATPAPEEFCGCPGAGGILPTACNATCNDGSSAGQYVRISAAIPRQTILPYPPLPLPSTLTAQSVLRLN
jgi:TadE-like protein